jgi:lysophospholipase L1-like esterase
MRTLIRLLLVCSTALLVFGSTASSAGKPLTLVALGDSIPYGGDCGGCTGFVTLYARAASRALGVPVTVKNLAEHNNLDSTQLLAQIRRSASMRAAVRRADIVTLTIGHNDTPWASGTDPCDGHFSDTVDDDALDWANYTGPCLAPIAAKLGANVGGILGEIKRLRGGKPTVVRVTNFHNDHYGDTTVPTKTYEPARIVTDALAVAICKAATQVKVPCADVYHAFNGPSGTRFDGPYVAGDHVHPNQKGHALITSLLARFGYAPLHRP